MKSNLERAKAHLERAYKGVSSLKVSGDVVDTIYEIREALRQAYRMVSEEERGGSPRHASGAALPPLTRGAFEEEDDSKKRCRGELCSPAEDDGQTQEVSGDAAAEDEV